jgi:hypothetical protein
LLDALRIGMGMLATLSAGLLVEVPSNARK